MEKNALKNIPRFYLYCQILMSSTQNFQYELKKMISNSKKKHTYKNIHTYTYNGKFEGNILVVERIGCGKTTFVQNVGKKKLFGDIKEVYWISKIELSTEREDIIKDCFKDQIVAFKYLARKILMIC